MKHAGGGWTCQCKRSVSMLGPVTDCRYCQGGSAPAAVRALATQMVKAGLTVDDLERAAKRGGGRTSVAARYRANDIVLELADPPLSAHDRWVRALNQQERERRARERVEATDWQQIREALNARDYAIRTGQGAVVSRPLPHWSEFSDAVVRDMPHDLRRRLGVPLDWR